MSDMMFKACKLAGVFQIDPVVRQDRRGFLMRTWCEREFSTQNLNTRWPQGNLTQTLGKGSIRGLHWQAEPHPEIKLIRCSSGAIWDVLVDVRRHSPTFGCWEAFELRAESLQQLYVPAGIAHGFQTLTEVAEVSYLMSDFYVAELARGVRWNDPRLGIPWPMPAVNLSERDQQLPLLSEL